MVLKGKIILICAGLKKSNSFYCQHDTNCNTQNSCHCPHKKKCKEQSNFTIFGCSLAKIFVMSNVSYRTLSSSKIYIYFKFLLLRCSTGLKSFSEPSCPVYVYRAIMIKMFQHWVKVILQKSFILICSGGAIKGDNWT